LYWAPSHGRIPHTTQASINGWAIFKIHVADLHLVRDAAEGDDGGVRPSPAAAMSQLLHAPVNPMTACLGMFLRPGTGALRQVADDEAASSAPERFAFRQRANVAQALGHDAAGGEAGFAENSPAIYGWVKRHQHKKSRRDERNSIQHLRRVIISVLLQENFQLLTKTFLPMMFFLRLDIMNRILHARHADAECAKTFLPCKTLWPEFGKCLTQPFRGIAFQQLHRLGNGKRRRQTQKQMHMVANAAEIRLEPFADGRREPRMPFRGGEHAMHQAGIE
jgi:hypothetical protein